MIRRAIIPDIHNIVDLVLEYAKDGQQIVEYDAETISELVYDSLFKENCAVLVAIDRGLLVGAIAGLVSPYWLNRNISVLTECWWFVAKDKRSSRAGIRLLKELWTWGKQMGATAVAMSSSGRDEQAMVDTMYGKLGLSLVDKNYLGRL